jgi:hypothetical protein
MIAHGRFFLAVDTYRQHRMCLMAVRDLRWDVLNR